MKKISIIKLSWLIVATACILLATSCKKSGSTDFAGTYYGTLTMGFYSEADTVIVTNAGSTSNVSMVSHTQTGSSYTITGTTSGAKLNIPSQQVYDAALNTTYTVSGSGTLANNNNSILINYLFVKGSSNYYWSFDGTK